MTSQQRLSRIVTSTFENGFFIVSTENIKNCMHQKKVKVIFGSYTPGTLTWITLLSLRKISLAFVNFLYSINRIFLRECSIGNASQEKPPTLMFTVISFY
jgi:hypothetical protein